MIAYKTLGKTRRWHRVEKKRISEIARRLGASRSGQITLYTRAALIAGLEEILAREKFASRLARVGSSVQEIVGDYLALVEIVRPKPLAQPITRDPDDDTVLAAAIAAGADAIVSGDKDLLTLGAYQNITIISVVECLQRLTRRLT